MNQFNYVGTWLYNSQTGAYQNDNHWSKTANSYFQVGFSGTQIKVYGALDANHGIAGVSIDGGTEVMVDYYAATRTDDALIWTSPTLSKDNHTLKVRLTGTKSQFQRYQCYL